MILEVKIINNKQIAEITVDESSKSVSYIYVDAYENINNYQSALERDHSFKFEAEAMSPERIGYRTFFRITGDMLNLKNNRVVNFWIAAIVYEDGSIEHCVIYDTNELYCLRMHYLRTKPECKVSNNEQLCVLMFREALLRNAMAINNIEDSVMFYTDIFRSTKSTNSNINACTNGWQYNGSYGK